MDVTRRPHDEPCRFFNNDPRIDTVRFYEALPNAPTLPFWSVVYCCENDPIKWPNDSIGTLRRTPFPFTGRVSPGGLLFNHICGTQTEFADGAVYNPATPPAPVGAQGLPLCCHPPPRVGGGAGVGGKAFAHLNQYVDPTAGGLGIGGSAGDVFQPAPAGGWTFVETNDFGFDVWKLVFNVSVPLTTGSFWLTFHDQVTAGASVLYWDQAAGATNDAITSFDGSHIPGESFILDPLYTNGTFDGDTNAYTIDGADGVAVTNQFAVSAGTVTQVTAWFWLNPGDTPTSIQWSFGTTSFGTDVANGTAS